MTPTPTPPTIHQCQSRQAGEWVEFTCPLCPAFRRRINYFTGAMEFTGEPDPEVRHEGQHVPPGLEVGGVGLN